MHPSRPPSRAFHKTIGLSPAEKVKGAGGDKRCVEDIWIPLTGFPAPIPSRLSLQAPNKEVKKRKKIDRKQKEAAPRRDF